MNLDRPRVLVTLICLFCLPILLAACKSGPDTCRTSKALLEDSFNNTRCGWPKYDQRDSAAGMTASEYSLIVRKAETTIFARPPLHTTDVLLETEVRHISGTEHNNYGLVCRQSGPHD
ncbi:MAG: hypothetical protein ABFQ89_04220, partial [Chloroflexota bacterium]